MALFTQRRCNLGCRSKPIVTAQLVALVRRPATRRRTRTLVSTTAMLTPDGTVDPCIHIFNRLWFASRFFRGGNGCPDVFQRVGASAGNNQPAFSVQTPDQAFPP